jgi:hypothetical protein
VTVQELIDLLEDCNPDTDVILATQAHYPHEHALGGLTTRKEMLAAEEEDDVDEPDEGDSSGDDVILVEGTWLGYGSKAAWQAAHRR